MTLRGDLLDSLKVRVGNENLNPLLPALPTSNILLACEGLEAYVTLMTLPKTKWPPTEGLSVVGGKTQGLVFTSQSGMGHASFVNGFSRGAAVVGLIIEDNQVIRLEEIVTKTINPISIGDAELPPVAPWLVRPLIESAANIVDKTDSYNLRDLLAFNYGMFWAAAAIIPPKHKGRQTAALKWLQAVVEYYGSLGLIPA